MSHVFHQLYYHFAWANHGREPLVDRIWRPQLLEIMNEEIRTRGGWPIRHKCDAGSCASALSITADCSDYGIYRPTKGRDFISRKQRNPTPIQIALAGGIRRPYVTQGRASQGIGIHRPTRRTSSAKYVV